jgi:hypothetical protein
MAVYTEDPITDPTDLTYVAGTDLATLFAASTDNELIIDYTNKKIALKAVGLMDQDGATIKCVYSKLKEVWRTDSTLVKFPFPMGPITDEQFEMVNGWNWDKTETSGTGSATTVELLRTGGWSVVNTSGQVTEMWAGIITLGSFADDTNQAYFQQVAGGTATNFKLTNKVNQAVQIYNDPNGDGSTVDGYDYRAYFKIFLREYQRTYAQSANTEIGATSMTYQAYRFPLSNAADLKITHNDTAVSTTAPYTGVNVTYLRNSADVLYRVRGNFASGTAYAEGDVAKDTGSNRWYSIKAGQAYTSTSTQPSSDSTHWEAYVGERLIGTTYFPFTVVIDADTDVGPTASGDAVRAQVYEKVQYLLRQNTDIDNDATASVIGKTADLLLKFVGDTLVTSNGVFIDSFNTLDKNDIEFYDATGAKCTFPYVATLTVNFGDNLKNDAGAKYWVFFTGPLPGGQNFGEADALLVDQEGVDGDMMGDISGASSVVLSFDYDNNTQGGRSAGTEAAITAVALGLSTGQYVKATGTIAKSKANSISLVAPLERNYSNL